MVYAIMQRGARCERFSKFAKRLPGDRLIARDSRYLFRCARGRNDRDVSSYQNPLRNVYSLRPLHVTLVLEPFLERNRRTRRGSPEILPPSLSKFGPVRPEELRSMSSREREREREGGGSVAFRKSYACLESCIERDDECRATARVRLGNDR